MANAVTALSLWSEENVRIATVLDALESLRRPEPMPPTRTSVLTLVVVATRNSSADRSAAALHELAGRHPARVLTLVVDDEAAEACIDAQLALLGSEAEGHPVWFEDVRLDVRGPVREHLDSLIEPFTIPDLPVVAWFVDRLPDAHDALLSAADVLLVDARDFGDTDCFARLAELRVRPVVDLSWHRVRPWRELLASLFDTPAARPFLDGIRSVTVRGKTGPRHLLGGWITSRLHVPTAEVHLEPADHVSVELVATAGGRRGVFGVARSLDEAMVGAYRRVDGGPHAEMVVPLPEPTAAWGLAAALSALERDHVYEAALDAAIALANR